MKSLFLTLPIALALAACGSDKAEAPAPADNITIIDNGTVLVPENETPTPARQKFCERQPWKCEEQPLQ